MLYLATLGAPYFIHGSRHVNNLRKSQWYTYLASEKHLVLPLLDAEVDKVCMQFEEKLCTLVAQYEPKPYVKLYVKLVKRCLILASLVTEFNELKVCTQFQENLAILIKFAKHAFSIVHTILQEKQAIHYLACENRPLQFYVILH